LKDPKSVAAGHCQVQLQLFWFAKTSKIGKDTIVLGWAGRQKTITEQELQRKLSVNENVGTR